MSGNRNRFGLSRSIPAEIKRAVRVRDGFGCIFCGNALITYDHFNPEFRDAETHDADHIHLMCGSCENKRRRGHIADSVMSQKIDQQFALSNGYSKEKIYNGIIKNNVFDIGSTKFVDCKSIIKDNGKSILWLSKSDEDDSFLLNFVFNGPNGKTILKIENNEVIVSSENFDFLLEKRRLKLIAFGDDYGFNLDADIDGNLNIKRMFVYLKKAFFIVDKNTFICIKRNAIIKISAGSQINQSNSAVEFTENGVGIASGGGSMFISESKFNSKSDKEKYPHEVAFVDGGARRNSRCFCGSGFRFKRCHGKFAQKYVVGE
ncbi:MAG: hypothetical protein ACRDBH_09725 [Bosea sp. (in: a-proteobacteria)]